MKLTLLDEITAALGAYTEITTGIRPEKKAFRLSRTGLLSLNAFIRTDAEAAAKALIESKERCRLWGISPIENMAVENGWLLFTLSPAFFIALCERAAKLERTPGTDYPSLRLRMLARKPASPCPDCERVHAVLLRCVFADDRGYFTAEDDRAVLTMTHCERGLRRIELERSCGTVAQALLMLRAK